MFRYIIYTVVADLGEAKKILGKARFDTKKHAYDYLRKVAKYGDCYVIEHAITGKTELIRKSHSNLIREN